MSGGGELHGSQATGRHATDTPEHPAVNLARIFDGLVTCDGQLRSVPLPGPVREVVRDVSTIGESATGRTGPSQVFGTAPQEVDPNDVVRGVERLLRRLVAPTIDLAVQLAPGVAGVVADPAELERVLVYLVLNARDAMPAGGRLTLETGEAELPAGCGPSAGRYVRIAVSATTPGITPGVVTPVPDPFRRADDIGRDCWLRLATVHDIVTRADGRILVSSTAGVGVYLPRAGDPAGPD